MWYKREDPLIRELIGDQAEVSLYFNGSFMGSKKIDWKNRRISIGYKWTRMIPDDHLNYVVSVEGNNKMHVVTE